MAEMSTNAIVDLCKKNGGYRQPHLNDQLYLQCKGFRKIENLDPYINCKCLWLDQNAISEVENLSALKDLCTLFLQDNNIRRLNANSLQNLANLHTLNLSNNHLSVLTEEMLAPCPLLETLQLAHNRFESLQSLEGILVCQKLSSVDVSMCNIEAIVAPQKRITTASVSASSSSATAAAAGGGGGGGGGGETADGECADNNTNDGNEEKDSQHRMISNCEKLVDFWKRLPELGVLYLHGNELPRKCKFYRKRMIVGLSTLMYLDERPVFADERRTTEAWGRGGNDAEDAERAKIRQEKLDEMERNVKSLMELKSSKKEEREARELAREKLLKEEQEWKTKMKIVWTRERTELDHAEYQRRGIISVDDEEEEFKKILALAQDSRQAAKMKMERRFLEEEVQKELEAEEKKIQAEIEKSKEKMRQRQVEMKSAVQTFIREKPPVSGGGGVGGKHSTTVVTRKKVLIEEEDGDGDEDNNPEETEEEKKLRQQRELDEVNEYQKEASVTTVMDKLFEDLYLPSNETSASMKTAAAGYAAAKAAASSGEKKDKAEGGILEEDQRTEYHDIETYDQQQARKIALPSDYEDGGEEKKGDSKWKRIDTKAERQELEMKERQQSEKEKEKEKEKSSSVSTSASSPSAFSASATTTATTGVKKKKSGNAHWDAFIQMESRHSTKRRF